MHRTKGFLGAALLLSLVGCIEFMSWSPDGRYLFVAYPSPGEDRPSGWIWDSTTGVAERVPQPGNIATGTFLDNKGRLLVFVDEPGDDKAGPFDAELGTLYVGDARQGNWTELLKHTHANGYSLSPDRSTLYYAAPGRDDPTQYELRSMDLGKPEESRLILKTPADMGFPQPSPSGDRVLLTMGSVQTPDGLYVIPSSGESTPKLVYEGDVYWPRWIDDAHVVYVRENEQDDDFTSLLVHDLDTGQSRVLFSRGFLISAPSVDATRKAVYVAGAISEAAEADKIEEMQILRVDVASGEVKPVTKDPLGAVYGTVDPTGKRLSYTNALNDMSVVHVVNLETGERTTVWRNEQERLYAAALRLEEVGDTAQALASYRDLLARYPDTDLSEPVWYHVFLLHLRPDHLDLDAAAEAIGHLGSELRQMALVLFWEGTERVATDPAGDLIRRYGTDQAAKEFEFDTDATRDLLGLWARWSARRLYLRVDFAVPHDLQGLAFMDLALLFNYENSTEPFRRITPCVEWDRPADREVWMRHWSDGGDWAGLFPPGPGQVARDSHYDMEILGPGGNSLARLDGSGFSPAVFPPCQILGRVNHPDGTGSLILALHRDILNLDAGRSIKVQLCTFKGGVEESHRGLERPRETAAAGGPPCFDVADAFGEENTAERVDSAIAGGQPAEIRGYAATLTPPN